MYQTNVLSRSNVLQGLVDIIVMILSLGISYNIAAGYSSLFDANHYIWVLIVYIPVWLFLMGNSRLYDKIVYFSYDKVLRIVLFSSFISGLLLAGMIFFVKDTMFSRTQYVAFVIMSFVTLLVEKFIYKFGSTERHMSLYSDSRTVIVGIPQMACSFTEYVNKNKIGKKIVGYVRVNGSRPLTGQVDLGTIEELDTIIKKNVIDEIIFALPKAYIGEVEKYILMCEEMGITVRMVLDLYDLKISRTYLSNVGTLPILTFDTVTLNQTQLFLKRLIDIVGAITGIMITGFISVFIIAAIKIDSPGPVIFSQNRVGLNGRTFKLYKFRSMCINADEQKAGLSDGNQVEGGLMFKIKNDPRITRVGRFIRKTSIDELPQFVNVLRGEMSLVGTRPPTPDEVSRYENYQRRRISIKPGITGLWQVSGRSGIMDFDEVVRLDTKYIDEWSIWLDLKIILKTIFVIFVKNGAY